MGRSTAAETEFRVSTVYGWLVDGHSRADVLQFGADKWKLKVRMMDELIARARERITEDCQLTRQEFLAESLAGLRSIRQQAERRGQMQVAINAIRLQAELTGMTN